MVITLTACSSPIYNESLESIEKSKDSSGILIGETSDIIIITEESPAVKTNFTSEPLVTITVEPTKIETPIVSTRTMPIAAPTVVVTIKPKEGIKEPTLAPTLKPTQAPTSKATEKQTPLVTAKLTIIPTPEPTPKPIAGEGYMDEMTSASSSYINSVLSAINSKRKTNGLDNAVLDSSISSSCKNHAKSMATKGQAFHSSNIVGCEGVSKNHYSMPAGTLGSAMVVHVGQLVTSDTNKVGVGIIYYGNYIYVCIRGVG
ncbi:MAG: hypothetical protein KAQ68_04715 [Clostridiales bacterium]|nr:hypothetical protein [Clostridiales bacterium]